MKRTISAVILKLGGEAVLLAIVGALVVGLLGRLGRWDTSLQYADAFFIAGCLLIVAGTASKLARSQDTPAFQWLETSAFHDLNANQQEGYVSDMGHSLRVVVVG